MTVTERKIANETHDAVIRLEQAFQDHLELHRGQTASSVSRKEMVVQWVALAVTAFLSVFGITRGGRP